MTRGRGLLAAGLVFATLACGAGTGSGAVATARIELSPGSATNPVGTSHTVTASVSNASGSLTGFEVAFAVTAGPNAGKAGGGTTDDSGRATFTYTGDGGAGTDAIEASFVDYVGRSHVASAGATWEPPPSPPQFPLPPASASPEPELPADLTIELKQDPASAAALGTPVRFTITITNNGPGVARDVTVRHEPPPSSTYESLFADRGSCQGTTAAVCAIGTLMPAEQAHVVLVARVAHRGQGSSAASVSGREVDPVPADNRATASITVADDAPPPVVGASVNVEEASGTVLIKLPGTDRFVDLSTVRQIPVGSIVDATEGIVRLTAAVDASGTTRAAVFYAGAFQILQPAAARVVTEARLVGADFSACPRPAKAKGKKKKGAKRRPAGSEAEKPKPVRRLWGSGTGSFRTRGRHSAATVRGTTWLVEDRCDGTLTRVTSGSVLVNDFVKKRQVVVSAGKSYLAASG